MSSSDCGPGVEARSIDTAALLPDEPCWSHETSLLGKFTTELLRIGKNGIYLFKQESQAILCGHLATELVDICSQSA